MKAQGYFRFVFVVAVLCLVAGITMAQTLPLGLTNAKDYEGEFEDEGEPELGGTIMGRIVETGTTTGLEGAIVSLLYTSYSTASNNNGDYVLDDVEQGVYILGVDLPGYYPVSIPGVAVYSGDYTFVNVELEPVEEEYDDEGEGEPPLGGTIMGRVVEAGTTTGLEGATVSLEYSGYSTTTNHTGNYVLDDVEQDVYTMLVALSGYVSSTIPGVVVSSGDYTFLDVELEPEEETGDDGEGEWLAYISGPSNVLVGSNVTLTFHAPPLPGPWQVQWQHNSIVLPEETGATLLIESVAREDAGWYTATQLSNDKNEPQSAMFYLTVHDALSLRGGMAIALLTLFIVLMGGKARIQRTAR